MLRPSFASCSDASCRWAKTPLSLSQAHPAAFHPTNPSKQTQFCCGFSPGVHSRSSRQLCCYWSEVPKHGSRGTRKLWSSSSRAVCTTSRGEQGEKQKTDRCPPPWQLHRWGHAFVSLTVMAESQNEVKTWDLCCCREAYQAGSGAR